MRGFLDRLYHGQVRLAATLRAAKFSWSSFIMPKPSPKTKLRPQPSVLFEATVRRMLATPPQPKISVKKKRTKRRKQR
jgi:hypothetical protein